MKASKIYFWFLLFSFISFAVQGAAPRESLIENKFGKFIVDPYRWMENSHDPALTRWVEQENKRSEDYLQGSLYEEIKAELSALHQMQLSASFSSLKSTTNNNFEVQKFRTMREKLLPFEQAELTTSTSTGLISPSRRYVVNITSDSGSDLKRLDVIDLYNGTRLPNSLVVKHPQVIWLDDNNFIYTTMLDGRMADYRAAIYRHTIGKTQPNDQLIYQEQEDGATANILSMADRHLLIRQKSNHTSINEIDFETGHVTPILDFTKGLNWPFSTKAEQLYTVSFENESMGEIVSINSNTGQIKTVMPAQKYAIQAATAVDEVFYVALIEHAASTLLRYDPVSGEKKLIPLPLEGNAFLLQNFSPLTIRMESYSRNYSIWQYNEKTESWALLFEEPSVKELESFRTYYKAHNGQEAAIWLVKDPDTKLSPETPIKIHGYGGFGINVMPRYQKSAIPWLSRGGVEAYVTLPGGREYGEDWHRAGMGKNKGNVFADFAAAAKHLIDQGYTSPARLIATGRSNGGLLIGAVLNRYPRLFRAAVPEVGVMDMTRFQLFTSGSMWTSEYGDRNKRRDFLNLLAISPYHNIRQREYPSVLVMTADFDDRVVPSHSYKYAARLQHNNRGKNPVLLYSKPWSSHSIEGTEEEFIKYQAMSISFMLKELGME